MGVHTRAFNQHRQKNNNVDQQVSNYFTYDRDELLSLYYRARTEEGLNFNRAWEYGFVEDLYLTYYK